MPWAFVWKDDKKGGGTWTKCRSGAARVAEELHEEFIGPCQPFSREQDGLLVAA
jgi:hypothetical protein